LSQIGSYVNSPKPKCVCKAYAPLSVYEIGEGGLVWAASLELGAAADIAVEDGFAYIAIGDQGLAVVDVSDPENPVLIGTAVGIGYAHRLAKHGNRVYITAGQFGVLEFDVSDPTSPVWVDTFYVSDTAEDVEATKDSLIVTTLTGAVELYGLRGKQRHQKMRALNAANWVKAIRLRGNHLFLLEPNGMVEEFDIGAVGGPRKVGDFDAEEIEVSGLTDENLQTTLDDSTWFSDGISIYEILDAE
jgi:hypothetical protein